MAEKELQTILTSGDITNIQIGGSTTAEKVIISSDLTGENIVFDKNGTALLSINVQAALAELANVGYSDMDLAIPYVGGQALTTTATKLSLFDTIHFNVNGAVTPLIDASEAVHSHKFTINKAGTYAVNLTVTGDFPTSIAATIELYKNGIATGKFIQLQGRGAGKPVEFVLWDIESLLVNDYLEIYAYADAATSLLITKSTMVVERKPI